MPMVTNWKEDSKWMADSLVSHALSFNLKTHLRLHDVAIVLPVCDLASIIV